MYVDVYLNSFSYLNRKVDNRTNMFNEISHSSLFVSDFLGSMYKKAVFTLMIAQEKVTEAAV